MKSISFTSKSVWRDLALLFVLALLIRLLAALPQQQPNYMDAAYYYVNALNLAAGRGFVEDFVWIYLDHPTPPPHPSHLYWLPLPSILAWAGMALGGTTYRAAQVSFVIASALLAPITYIATYILSRQRWQSWLAGLLMIFSGFYFPFWTAIDNFTPFAVFGSLALLTAWWGMVNYKPVLSEAEGWQITNGKLQITSYKSQITNNKLQTVIHNSQFTIHNSQLIILSGICAGLAHLSRADGPLLLVAIILTVFLYFIFHDKLSISRFTFHVSRFTLFLLLGYLLIMTPWFIRNWQVVGAPLSAAGMQTIWLTTYDDLFSYGRELSLQTFWAQGLQAIWQGRWWALKTNLQTVLAVWGMVFGLPLALIGYWHLRRHVLMQLAGWYALLLFIAMTFIFAFPGARGGLFHSGGALLPFIYAAAAVGLDRSIKWVVARRSRWDARLAQQFFGVGLVVMAVALSSFIYNQRVLKNNTWNRADGLYPVVAAWVAQQNPEAVVMINNPPAYRYHGGGLSVAIPNEDIETTLQAARRYRVDYLILEYNHPAPLDKIYKQTVVHPQLSLVKTFEGVYIYKIIQP
ncbi:MAG: hypothetical protein JW953_19995 [Anaerolineae bacterium]|nr:hypothetical protein [Anaerolineae bacterium]